MERIFFRNIPLSNWVEQEMPFDEGVDQEQLAQSMSVFSGALVSSPAGRAEGRARPRTTGVFESAQAVVSAARRVWLVAWNRRIRRQAPEIDTAHHALTVAHTPGAEASRPPINCGPRGGRR